MPQTAIKQQDVAADARRFLTVEQTMSLLQISRRTFYRIIRVQGKHYLRSYLIGRVRRTRLDEVLAYADAQNQKERS